MGVWLAQILEWVFANFFYLHAKWEHEIVSKRILGLLFFFDLCVRKNFWEQTNKFEFLIFGWISLTRLKFSTSFLLKFQNCLRLFFDYVLSQVTDLMCKYAHNVMSINDHRDNVSINITCSLWDTLCILEVSFWVLVFFRIKKSKFQISNLFFFDQVSKCWKKNKVLQNE